MGLVRSYRLRLERKRWLIRAFRKRRELKAVANRTNQIQPDDILLVCTVWNEQPRLAYFLKYYRNLGIRHFLFIDNGSDDGTDAYLERQSDVSLWRTEASYKRSRFGMDWVNWLLRKYAQGHWVVTVDADEFLVYPFADSRPLDALTDWLDESGARSFPAMLLDMYPKESVVGAVCRSGENPVDVAPWFDGGNYVLSRNPKYENLWIQGGPRARMFFADAPYKAPSLNKIPLVKWHRRYAYVQSTHMLLPRGLNQVYDVDGGEKISGCLLHTKFISTLTEKAALEAARNQHFAGGREYQAYGDGIARGETLWCRWSERYVNWRQLELLGLMSKGNWA